MKKCLKWFGLGLLTCTICTLGIFAIAYGIFFLTQVSEQTAWIAAIVFLFSITIIALGITFVSAIGFLVELYFIDESEY